MTTTREERDEYRLRLMGRLSYKAILAVPPELRSLPEEAWDDLRRSEDMLHDATVAFVDGEVGKDELDAKAVAWLGHWRETIRRYT